MPSITIDRYDDTIDTWIGEAEPASASVQLMPNEIGTLECELEHDDPQLYGLMSGDILMASILGAPKASFRVTSIDRTEVDVGAEAAETVIVNGDNILSDWENSIVEHPLGPFDQDVAKTVPPMMDRAMTWQGIDYDHTTAGGWSPTSNAMTFQGWLSAYWQGEPSGYSDPFSWWIGPHSGDHTHADPGDCLFIKYTLVGVGMKRLQFAGDNVVRAYINGEEVGSLADWRQSTQYDFEVVEAGWLKLAFWVTNAPDDGPLGGNPMGLLFNLRDGLDGPVNCRSDEDTWMLEYPSTMPTVSIGRMIRRIMPGNQLLDDWTVTGDEEEDQNGNPFPLAEGVSFRVGSDTCWDALKQLTDVWIDVRPAVSALQLQVVNKGAWRVTSPFTFTTGYSTAAQSAPDPQDVANVTALDWELAAPLCDMLKVRWGKGWFAVGSGKRVKFLDLGQIMEPTTAVQIANAYMALYGQGQYTATVSIDPNPWQGYTFSEWSRVAVPAPGNDNATSTQNVVSLTYVMDNDGEMIANIECGSLARDAIEWLENATRRGSVAGSLLGRANFASLVRPQPGIITKPSHSEWTVWATDTGVPLAGMVGSTATPANPPVPAQVQTMRLRGNNSGASGTTTVDIYIDGYAFVASLGASDSFANIAIDVPVSTGSLFSVSPRTDGGHTGLILQATVSGT